MTKALAAAGFLGCILAANYVTTQYGLVPVGFGLTATAGTYFAGLAFILRDTLQDTAGKRFTVAVIAVGAVLSFAISAPFIALASAVAFGLSEIIDLCVYTPLRSRGYVRAAVASNIAGTLVDSVVFLTIAGFPLWASLPGQIVGKLSMTVVAVALVTITRVARNRSVTA
jgi:queuosine precursor transporter